MKIQTVFNNQKWGDEVKCLLDVKERMEELTGLDIDILPALYTNFTDIPFNIIPYPFTNELGEAPTDDWYRKNIYSLNRDADILVLILKESDWPDNPHIPGRIYGYCINQYPETFPPFITVLADQGDYAHKRYPKKTPALKAYIPHEVAHGLARISGVSDKTHELDYKGKTKELYQTFNYEKIKLALNSKRKLDGQVANFYFKQGDPTGFVAVEGKLVGISTDDTNLRKDWPTAKFINLSPDEFLKFDLANFHTLTKRK